MSSSDIFRYIEQPYVLMQYEENNYLEISCIIFFFVPEDFSLHAYWD